MMLLLLWAAGGVVYDRAADAGLMAPASPLIFNDPKLKAACAANWTRCASLPKEHTAFGPWMYSLDVVTPIVTFGLERDWAPVYAVPCTEDKRACSPELPAGSVVEPFGSWMAAARDVAPPWAAPWLPRPAGFLWGFYWAQIALGWFLSALLVAVLTGLVKRE